MRTLSYSEMAYLEGGKNDPVAERNGCIILNEVLMIGGLITLAQPEIAPVYALAAGIGVLCTTIGLLTC